MWAKKNNKTTVQLTSYWNDSSYYCYQPAKYKCAAAIKQFPRRSAVALRWHTATLSHARERFLEARRGWCGRARVPSAHGARGGRTAVWGSCVVHAPKLGYSEQPSRTERSAATARATLVWFTFSQQRDRDDSQRTESRISDALPSLWVDFLWSRRTWRL